MNYYRGRPQGTMRSVIERGDPRKMTAYGLFAWWRRQLGVTVATGVSHWISYESIDLAQSTAGAQPAVDATGGPDGGWCISSDGSDDVLQASFTLAQPQHLLMVAKYDAAFAAADDLFGGNNSAGTGNIMRVYREATGLVHMVGDPAGAKDISASGFTTTTWHSLGFLFNGASSYCKEDGVARISGDAGTGTASGMSLFAAWFFGGALNFANASVTEIAVFSTALPADIERRVENRLRAVSGMAVL